MRGLRSNDRATSEWWGWARSRRGLQRSLLWCLLLFGAAQLLLLRPRFSSHRVTERVAAGRVVITGGGGTIGKHIAQRLLATRTPVTVVDHIFYPDELGPADLAPSSLLTVHTGDIRNATLLSSVFTPDVVGVVHLAAISRVLQCEENPLDCVDVNERGTRLVLDSLEQLNRHDQGERWFVLASSIEVYGDATTIAIPLREDAPTKPPSNYGASKLAAERIVEARVRTVQSSTDAGTLHAVALRLSHVYGGSYDHYDRLIPSITAQALWDQVIQISGGQQTLDMLHVEDCVDAFLLAIQHLTLHTLPKLNPHADPLSPAIFQVFNIASGRAISVSRLVDKVISFAQSKSPIRKIPPDARFSSAPVVDVHKARQQLGFRSSLAVEKGLIMTLKMYLSHFDVLYTRRMEATCGTPSPTRSLDMQLDKLDGCTAHIHVNDQDRLASLSVSHTFPFLQVDDAVLGSGLYIKAHARPDAPHKRVIRIRDLENGFYFGVKNPIKGPASFERVTEGDLGRYPNIYVDWEIEANPDASSIRLVLSGTKLQLAGPKSSRRRALRLISMYDLNSWPFRITPSCCPAPGPWPFLADDPVDVSVEYQRDSVELPFLTSSRKTLCGRLEAARKRVKGKLAVLSSPFHHGGRREMSPYAANWSLASLPACSNLCEDTTICVNTGDCQCIEDSCVHRRRFPLSATRDSGVSFPPRTVDNESLVEAVKQISWKDILRPSPRRFIDAEVPFLRIRVAPLSPTNKAFVENLGHEFHTPKDGHCFSADYQLEQGVVRMGMHDQDAETTFVPMYWKRFSTVQSYFEQYDYVKDHLQGFNPGRVVMPFTHDWGQCVIWVRNLWMLRETHGRVHYPMVRNTTAWSVMGDLNSICYRPHQDVVVPPRSCQSERLFESFDDLSRVRPARERRVLATFSGTPWGTGAYRRARIQCARNGWTPHSPERRLHPSGPPLVVYWNTHGPYGDYMGILNDTLFCPQPAGSTGWTTRLVDSMYAGCIPVFIGHATHYAFFDMLDWSKLSVRIEPHEISHLEELLLSRYSLEEIEQLQRNVLAMRNAFVYPLDDMDDTTAQRRVLHEQGPLYFALQSTRMKIMTEWPL